MVGRLIIHSIEQVVFIVLVVCTPALSALSSLAALSALAVSSGGLRLHLNVSVGKSVEKQIGSHFLVFVAGEVGLGGLQLAETQLSQAVDGLLIGVGD
jgi:hypothetical protein